MIMKRFNAINIIADTIMYFICELRKDPFPKSHAPMFIVLTHMPSLNVH
jgi:hypothetical protein